MIDPDSKDLETFVDEQDGFTFERPDKVATKSVEPREVEIQLTEEQADVVKGILEWALDKNAPTNVKVLSGYAGTGKTECIRRIVSQLEDNKVAVAICAFTGKAVSVLKKKGVHRAQTLHRLMYEPVYEDTRFVGFRLATSLPVDFVVVDEASMLSKQLDDDLRKFPVKILYVGDSAQLEPIGEDANLMRFPDYQLTQIHRQAEQSPIIQFSMRLRQNLPFSYGRLAGLTISPVDKFWENIYDCDQAICAFNKVRHQVNQLIRAKKEYTDLICTGDKMICLKNAFNLGVYNGLMATVINARKCTYRKNLWICDFEDELGNRLDDIQVDTSCIGVTPDKKAKPLDRGKDITYWDYGYCITCHKAQGSEWDKVVVLQEYSSLWNMLRWGYTAATRAAKELVYCV